MSVDREALAEVIWDAAESDSGRNPVSWTELSAKAARNALDYPEIQAMYYRMADAVIASLPEHDPVPVVANRVLDRLHEVWQDSFALLDDDIAQVRAEFGVTE